MLTTATTNKATTDTAAKLEAEAAAIRTRLAKAPAIPTTNALGEVLGRFLSISAASAATVQQALISAIVELVIAATLALPELLRPPQTPVSKREGEHCGSLPDICTTQKTEPPTAEPGSVRRFMLACIKRSKGEKITRGAVYKRYLRWCDGPAPRQAAADPVFLGTVRAAVRQGGNQDARA